MSKMAEFVPVYEVEAICDDCGEEIEECHYRNDRGQTLHVTTVTNGHYYLCGHVSCGACADGGR